MARQLASTNPYLKDKRTPRERKIHLQGLQMAKPNSTQHSLLLDLPPELRNRIYDLVLVRSHKIDIDASRSVKGTMTRIKTKVKMSNAVIVEPRLLQTCRIVQSEATQMYYGLNVFKCSSINSFYRWLKGIGLAKQNMLRHLRCSRRYGSQANDPRLNPRVLKDLHCFESELAARGIHMKDGVLRVYITIIHGSRGPRHGGSATARTRSEIEAVMTKAQWDHYHAYFQHFKMRDIASRRQRSAAPEVE